HQAKEELVVVLASRTMFLEEPPHCGGFKEIEDQCRVVEQHSRQRPFERGVEPLVHDIHSKPTLLARQNRGRQILAANLAMQPLTLAPPDLERGTKTLRNFD